jgi:sigma-E factor negative regulatory protein RseA
MVMGEDISRLMDGEIDEGEQDVAWARLKRDEGRQAWECYHVIGDALRGAGGPTAGFSERFAARFEAEPTVLAPKPLHGPRLPFVWAAAATVAAVAVVGWVAVSTLDSRPTALAKAREAAAVRAAQARSAPVSPDYLLAHQEYSPTTQIQGVGPYLRAVSAGGADGRP